jgi:hypothetical protein
LARPAPIFLVGVLVVLIVWSFTVRRLVPHMRDVGRAGMRGFPRRARKEHGIRLLLIRRGLVAGTVVAVIMWLLMEWSAIYNCRHIIDEGWTLRAASTWRWCCRPQASWLPCWCCPARAHGWCVWARRGRSTSRRHGAARPAGGP